MYATVFLKRSRDAYPDVSRATGRAPFGGFATIYHFTISAASDAHTIPVGPLKGTDGNE